MEPLPALHHPGKTDKGLPKCQDADDVGESDVFILSGAKDLVPLSEDDQPQKPRKVGGVASRVLSYRVRRYRPRIEGLFARIERWTNESDPTDAFWGSISKDNVMTWYGRTPDSRISDPGDAARIFSWLICESYDDKGNVLVYGYKEARHGETNNLLKETTMAYMLDDSPVPQVTYVNTLSLPVKVVVS